MAGHRASEGPGAREPLRYGKQHAQTDELYHAHALEKQLEALAAEEEKESPLEAAAPSPGPETAAAAPAPELPAPVLPIDLGVPIGSLGEAEAPPTAESSLAGPQKGVVRDTVKEARGRFEAVVAAAVKLAKEAGHLVHLPLEVLRRVRHQSLRRPGWI